MSKRKATGGPMYPYWPPTKAEVAAVRKRYFECPHPKNRRHRILAFQWACSACGHLHKYKGEFRPRCDHPMCQPSGPTR